MQQTEPRATMRAGLYLWLVVAVVAVGVGVAILARADSGPAAGSTQPLLVGVTHTQHTIDPWDPPRARSLAEDILRSAAPVQNQFLMGWGALNPEPSPGVYDWSSLDARMDLIRRTGGQAVITLCGAPDWMKGGSPGQTSWSKLWYAPLPEHYADFADLAVQVAQRYPFVRHFVVWSEMRGFFDSGDNTWDDAAYVQLYNTVYRALKAYDPQLQVGGPDPVMDSYADAATMSHPSSVRGAWGVVDRRPLETLEHWLADSAGSDFLVMNGTTANRGTGLALAPVHAVDKFRAIDAWVRQRTSLPIWWLEAYSPDGTSLAATNLAVASPASIALMLGAIQESGGAVALLWNPEGTSEECANCLWTSPDGPGGSRETGFVPVLEKFAAHATAQVGGVPTGDHRAGA